jgi:peroxiredoxin Q/BCP
MEPTMDQRNRPASAGPVQVGDRAPDFTLPDQRGGSLSLSSLLGKGGVVLFFYPKDNTRGCTAEACSFRDNYEVFQEAGAEVIGISSDSADSHQQFADRYSLPYRLLSDPGGAVRARYGVPRTLGILPGRVTYILDRDGVVRHVFDNQFAPKQHVAEALRILRSLPGG